MNARTASGLWLGLGAAGLAILWTAVLFRPAWLIWAGGAFTAVPFAAAAIEFVPRARKDPATAVAALGLILLFSIAWLL
jgi:hypothetical protein